MTEKKETKKETKTKAASKTAEVSASESAEKKTKAPKKETTATKAVKKDFAVIATGGKQYVVREGDFVNVEKLGDDFKEGAKIEFDEVLLRDNGKDTEVGEPTVKGAKVVAEFVENGRDKKISVIRFRAKSRYFKNKGHRQSYTRVKITKVA